MLETRREFATGELWARNNKGSDKYSQTWVKIPDGWVPLEVGKVAKGGEDKIWYGEWSGGNCWSVLAVDMEVCDGLFITKERKVGGKWVAYGNPGMGKSTFADAYTGKYSEYGTPMGYKRMNVGDTIEKDSIFLNWRSSKWETVSSNSVGQEIMYYHMPHTRKTRYEWVEAPKRYISGTTIEIPDGYSEVPRDGKTIILPGDSWWADYGRGWVPTVNAGERNYCVWLIRSDADSKLRLLN
jgi:hypothetical protein